MLYITTRSSDAIYTSRHTLKEDLAPDGGCFIPTEFPVYTEEQLLLLREKSFGAIVADVLNLFYPNQLTGWDVDFCIGRTPFRIVSMNHRIAVAELWRNLQDDYRYVSDQLYSKVLSTGGHSQQPTYWFRIVVSIAVYFALYGELLKNELVHTYQKLDISVLDDDFVAPLAALCAKKMGLPVGCIICSCRENSSVWELIHRGNFNTAIADDRLQKFMEHLIYLTLGHAEAVRFVEKCRGKQLYFVDEELMPLFNGSLFCAVPGISRSSTVINSVYRTSAYLMDPNTALCYGGMQDYRARTGQSRTTLLMCKETPIRYSEEIVLSAGVSEEALLNQIKQF